MSGATEEEEVLRAADSACSDTMEIYIRDGAGQCRTLVASVRPRTTISRCEGHFVAHGVCIDCTQAAGKTVWAS
jgi:hypothetical protein